MEGSSGAADVSDPAPAAAGNEAAMLAKKDEGNAKLKAKDYAAAVGLYQEAIDLLTPAMGEAGAAVYSNMSLARMRLGEYQEALLAARCCVAERPTWEKGFFRQGEALFALRRYAEAAEAYDTGLKHKPGDADLSFSSRLAKEAAKGGVWFRQLSPGRDIAISQPKSQTEGLIFGAAKNMNNFIYLVGCATTRECYCFDPAWDTNGIAAVCERFKMKLIGAMGTHYHFDHIGGAVPPQFAPMLFGPFGSKGGDARMVGLREMKTDHGAQLYAMSVEVDRIAKQIGVPASDITPLAQGSTLPVGEAASLEILHTPGHSSGSICIRTTPKAESGGDTFILSGDCIFPGSCGRLDLPDSDKSAMFDSLVKLRGLDDQIKVYPGHGYSGGSTTIGEEKRSGLLRPFNKEMFMTMFG